MGDWVCLFKMGAVGGGVIGVKKVVEVIWVDLYNFGRFDFRQRTGYGR